MRVVEGTADLTFAVAARVSGREPAATGFAEDGTTATEEDSHCHGGGHLHRQDICTVVAVRDPETVVAVRDPETVVAVRDPDGALARH
ncbi:hypothetical protein ADK57_08290 [Streptomyces sp. MMG1533]|nr:hypothetical protein ADK57_08290 [Streptomyces sp. MMG1533]